MIRRRDVHEFGAHHNSRNVFERNEYAASCSFGRHSKRALPGGCPYLFPNLVMVFRSDVNKPLARSFKVTDIHVRRLSEYPNLVPNLGWKPV